MVIVADINEVIATYNQDESDEKCVSKSEWHVDLSETHTVVVHCIFTSFTARALQAVPLVHYCTRLSVRMINTESQ